MATYEIDIIHTVERRFDGSAVVERETRQFDTDEWPNEVKQLGMKFRNRYRTGLIPLRMNDTAGVLALCREIHRLQHSNGDSSTLLKFCLYCWQLKQQNEIKADAWAIVFGATWQSGERESLLFMARLEQSTVLKMFEAANQRYFMFLRDDWSRYNALPETLTVWRGVCDGMERRSDGFSWSSDRRWATWFAYRNAMNHINLKKGKPTPQLLSAIVDKKNVLAIVSTEDEVIVRPGSVREMATEQLPDGNFDRIMTELFRDLTGVVRPGYGLAGA